MNVLMSTGIYGLIYAILAIGVYITFRILNFADMTAEGSLSLGGSVCAVFLTSGMNPIISIVLAGLIGSLAGLFTGFLHTKFKIQAILSGILTMVALYSINLKIMGKSNISLLDNSTIFGSAESDQPINLIIVIGICLVLLLSLNLFFKTNLGLSIRATGDNEQMMRALATNTNSKKILALMISNGLCGVAGALLAQNQGYSDVNMGTGTIVIALASIVIGEALVSQHSFLTKLISVVVGTIVYRAIIAVVLNLGMNPIDLKMFTAFVAAILLGVPNIRKTLKRSVISVKN